MTPAAIELATALSSAVLAPPPRLMLATAGLTACGGHPVDAGDRPGVGAAAGAVRARARATSVHALGHAVGGAADGAGDVGAVAVAVVGVAAVDGVEAGDGPAAEVGVGDPDAGVDDVRVHVARRWSGRCTLLSSGRSRWSMRSRPHEGGLVWVAAMRDGLVLLDVGDLRVRGQPAGAPWGHRRRRRDAKPTHRCG